MEDRDGSRRSITAGLKQRCDLHTSEDLEAFGTQADMRLARGETLLRADRMSSDASGVYRETSLLQIQADGEATARQRMQAEQQLYEEAEKIEERKKQLATARPKISSAALEKLQFENCIGRAKTSCDSALQRFKNALKTMRLEIEQMSEQDSTTMSEMKKGRTNSKSSTRRPRSTWKRRSSILAVHSRIKSFADLLIVWETAE